MFALCANLLIWSRGRYGQPLGGRSVGSVVSLAKRAYFEVTGDRDTDLFLGEKEVRGESYAQSIRNS